MTRELAQGLQPGAEVEVRAPELPEGVRRVRVVAVIAGGRRIRVEAGGRSWRTSCEDIRIPQEKTT